MATFTSINELDCLEFHDATINAIRLSDNKMIWSVSFINVTTQNTQNSNKRDMCVDNATIIFENVSIIELKTVGYKSYNSKGELVKTVEERVLAAEEYSCILAESVDDNYCYIYAMDEFVGVQNDCYRACFSIDAGDKGGYNLTFTFSKAIVEWDEYNGEAWYEPS